MKIAIPLSALLTLVTSVTGCGGPPSKPVTSALSQTPRPPPPPERRQFDFWVGQWDAIVSARKSPDGDEWTDAKGTNEITSVLGGHGVEEHFIADGPGTPWEGRSLSIYVAAQQRWRQTWIDDSGAYLAFVGTFRDGEMVLEGEPVTQNGVTSRMRMVFTDITPQRFLWRWEKTKDDGRTWRPMMKIVYTRRR